MRFLSAIRSDCRSFTHATLLLGLGSIVVTPDAPLLLFATIAFWALIRMSNAQLGWWWLIVGLAGGGALLSKYTAGLLVVAIALWVLLTPRVRGWMLSTWPWIGAGVSALCFMPVLFWNAEHGWISFAKQGGRLARPEGLGPQLTLEFIGGQIGVITPGIFLLLIIAVAFVAQRAWQRRDPIDSLIALWFLVPAIFFLAVSPTMRVQANWLAPAWPAAFVALAALVERHSSLPKLHRTLPWAIGFGAVMVAFVWAYAVSPFGPHFHGDPLAGVSGQRAFAAEVAAFARQNASRQLVAPDYATAAMLRFYAPADMSVAHLTDEPRYSGFPAQAIAMPAVIVSRRPVLPSALLEKVHAGSPAVPLWRTYRGMPHSKYFLFVATEMRR